MASSLEPRRIAAMPNIVLVVVVDTSVTDNAGVTFPQIRQLELQPVPPLDDSMIKVEIISQNATPASSATPRSSVEPNTTFSSSTPSIATSTVRRNKGLVETAMENYTHIDRPLAFLPSARGPLEVLDDQPPTIKEPVVPSHSVNSSDSQLQRPQSVITNVPMESDVVQIIISAFHGNKDAQDALDDMYKDGKGLRKTIGRPWIGTSRPPSKDMPLHNPTSELSTTTAKKFPKATQRRWNGSSRLPSKITTLLNITAAYFIKTAAAFPRII